jgi:hypothetical protein
MTEKRGNRVKRILDSKRQPPEYQRLDIEPREGGKSLLHDDFGLPKVGPAPSRGDIPQMREVSNKPVSIKASVPDESRVQIAKGGIPQKGRPSRAAEQTFTKEEDDGFIPPKNNFVNVGQTEHAWYDEKVAGPSEMVDNNALDSNAPDEQLIDTDSLQGTNPLADIEQEELSEIRKQFEQRLQYIQDGVLSQLEDVVNLEDLEQFKANILGKSGVISTVLKQFKKLDSQDRQVVGELVNSVIDTLRLEFEAKEYEFLSDEEEDEDEESEHGDFPEEEDSNENLDVGPRQPQTAKVSAALAEGQYAVLVDDKLFTVVDSAQEARQVLSRLILGNNVDVERIQLIKRIPIDFGVVLYED